MSIRISNEKAQHRPVERLIALAERLDRSVNHLVVKAILEYLKREEKEG